MRPSFAASGRYDPHRTPSEATAIPAPPRATALASTTPVDPPMPGGIVEVVALSIAELHGL
jgi:hypothetical protein